jgi:GT2 family glycosyltransferase
MKGRQEVERHADCKTVASVAVVMSTFNEERYIDRSLDAIAAQTIRPRVVVVDGGSADRTVERLAARAAADPSLHVLADGLRRSLPEALNLGIEITQEAFVAKVDARTFVQPDFLERALEIFEREGPSVGCVGGRPEQYGETSFGEGFARARMSRFGVGGSGYADARASADVDTVQCGVYRRSALLAVGGFDPSLQFGEDEEVNWRLRQAGYRIVRDSSVRFRYLTRSTWQGAFSQYRNYGRARVRVLEKHPEFIRVRHLIPSAAVLAGAALLGAAPFSRSARLAGGALAALYAGGALAAAAAAARDDARNIPYTAAAFTALHLGYGVGLVEGSWRALSARLQRSGS